jgi:putative spermidine/putrescine transport system permease protein
MQKTSFWSWLWLAIGVVYFFLPLFATFEFSLRATRGVYSFTAYQEALGDPEFIKAFSFSGLLAIATIIIGFLLIVPTAYWVQLRLPRLRPIVEFITLAPFVIPAIILVFGLIKTYGSPIKLLGIPILPPLTNTAETTNILLVAGYVVLALPYMYRAVDTGLRAIDVRTLTEAAQSLGANWFTILFRVIFPNLRVALISGAFLTLAIVIGEFVLATYLNRPAYGPYLNLIGDKTYIPEALTIVTLLLTWGAMIVIQFLSRGAPGQLTGRR